MKPIFLPKTYWFGVFYKGWTFVQTVLSGIDVGLDIFRINKISDSYSNQTTVPIGKEGGREEDGVGGVQGEAHLTIMLP